MQLRQYIAIPDNNVGSTVLEILLPQVVKLARFRFKSETKCFYCRDMEGLISIEFFIESIVIFNQVVVFVSVREAVNFRLTED